MKSVRAFVICTLVLWNQCSPHFVPRDVNTEDESVVEDLKVAKLSDSEDEFGLLQFSMFGKTYSFKLVPANSIFSPNFKIFQQQIDYQIDYKTLKESEPLEGSFYTDENGRASFYIEHKNGEIQLDGFVDDKFVISNSQGRHKATKKIIQTGHQIDRSFTFETLSKPTVGKDKHQHDVATIEVLDFLDQIVHNNLIERKASIKKYLGIYWNIVQNKYKVFSNPRVQFSLSGVIALSDTTWMNDTFHEPNRPDAIEFVTSFGNWLYAEKQAKKTFPKYDVAVLHTGFDLSIQEDDELSSSVLGIAATGGICQDFHEDKMSASMTVVEDFNAPTFAGAIVVTHEIGHLLSADHDDTEKCDLNGIMSPYVQPISLSTKLFCNTTVEQIQNHLNSDETSCLFDSPQSNLPIGPEVPIMTRDNICKMAYGDNFNAGSMDLYSKSLDPCVYVICLKDDGSQQNLMWVPERTDCGDDGKVCIEGICTQDGCK